MKSSIYSAALALFLASSPAFAASSALPRPIQTLLEQMKGDWVILDQTQDLLDTRLSLQADGEGRLVNRFGSSAITWRLEHGKIKITLLSPTEIPGFEYHEDENGNGIDYATVTSLQSLSLEFQKLESLSSIIWKLSSTSIVSYPDHPEKGTKESTHVMDRVKLVAGRQFKNFAPRQGQILSLTLPDYQYSVDGSELEESVSILVRFDAANVLSVLGGQAFGLDHLFWTLDQGSLRVSDGRGYTASFQQYQADSISHRLLVDVVRPDRHFASEEVSVVPNDSIRAQGFQPQSPLFEGCWNALQASYCFKADRTFSFTTRYSEGENYSGYGLWKLIDGKIKVERFRNRDGMDLMDTQAMLNCENELSDDAIREKSCAVYSTRTYELLNQNAHSVGVYRWMQIHDYTSHAYHTFRRVK